MFQKDGKQVIIASDRIDWRDAAARCRWHHFEFHSILESFFEQYFLLFWQLFVEVARCDKEDFMQNHLVDVLVE